MAAYLVQIDCSQQGLRSSNCGHIRSLSSRGHAKDRELTNA